ncbi:hypothetical protein ACFQE1_14115 [Halobium palmae]|uniref:DUF8106 domain-containing protein n=1 Tax=Halobium palmae TaxID=1776492 RepID=A0ABD5S1A0_9EURY
MNASALRARRSAGSGGTKAVLHCPTCGRDSPLNGDWERVDEPSRVVYVCPGCESTLTVRPKF